LAFDWFVSKMEETMEIGIATVAFLGAVALALSAAAEVLLALRRLDSERRKPPSSSFG